jgi:hypothetical protein
VKEKADVAKMKQEHGFNTLALNLLGAFQVFHDTLVGLRYGDVPNYQAIKTAFAHELDARGSMTPIVWDWDRPDR